jgi:hypothetical protein
MPNHLIYIVQYNRKKLSLNPTSPGLESRTDFSGCGLCFCNPSAETNNFDLGALLSSCLISELQKPSSPELERRPYFLGCTFVLVTSSSFETNCFGLGAFLLSCSVSELQEPPSPGFELRTIFLNFDLSKISSWSQGISVQNLVQIDISVLEL